MPDSIRLSRRPLRHILSVAALALVVTGVVCDHTTRVAPQQDDHARYHDRSFRTVRVVDGDTLDIDAPDGNKPVTRIRLWGVDTPEVDGSPRGEMYYGPEASAFAKRTLANRIVHIVLSPNKTRGKFGRLLAYVYLERGGRMFNEMLLEEGYAYADLRFRHHYFRRFKNIETRARREKRGLWADVTLEQMPRWKQRFERKDKPSGR
ncbi:MAG: thermonuclease family protein [Phycisphaerae bacterium]